MSITRWLQRNPVESVGLLIVTASLGFALPGMMQQFQDMGAVSREIQKNAAEQQRLEAQQEALKERALIAEDRYRNGCLLVQLRSKNTLISLSQGMPVVDNQTGHPIPPGTSVCDYSGNTAVMAFNGSEPVAVDLAFTGNREIVKQAMQRSGIQLVPGARDYTSGTRVNGLEE